MRYPGGKNAAGTFQRLINLIPEHRVHIEPFAGSASIFFHKREAQESFLLDRDREQCAALRRQLLEREASNPPMDAINRGAITRVITADALHWLPLSSHPQSPDTFIYCDPPYVLSTRRDPDRQIYKFEMTDTDHKQLLELLVALPCMVMLSGYPCGLYNRALKEWHEIQFRVMTRGGNSRLESVWMNYPRPYKLHDYSYVGEDYRKRQDFKRMRTRWVDRIAGMDDLRRFALMSALETLPPQKSANELMLEAREYQRTALAKQRGKTNGKGKANIQTTKAKKSGQTRRARRGD